MIASSTHLLVKQIGCKTADNSGQSHHSDIFQAEEQNQVQKDSIRWRRRRRRRRRRTLFNIMIYIAISYFVWRTKETLSGFYR